MKSNRLISFILLSVLFVAIISPDSVGILSVEAAPQVGTVLYVKPEASGAGNCSSWEDACGLQDALAISSFGDEIWVSAGIYKPALDGNRAATFQMVTGVSMYGGFNGTETDRSQRDWEEHSTVLSGDLLGDDQPDFNNYEENSFHVVSTNALDTSSVLDGCTITGGNASGDPADPCDDQCGGGIYNIVSSPTLSNLIIEDNMAIDSGGGMYNGSGSSPKLRNVRFLSNTAVLGGGMYNISSSPLMKGVTFIDNGDDGQRPDFGGGVYNLNSNPVMIEVIFNHNIANERGGGLYNTSSSPALINVTFFNNQATWGGGIGNYLYSNPSLSNVIISSNLADRGAGIHNYYYSSPVLTNLTIKCNQATRGGGIYNSSYSNPIIANSIIWGNIADSDGAQIYSMDSSTASIGYSDLQDSGGSGGDWDNSLGIDNGGNIDIDPNFYPGDNLRPQLSSPVIDSGDNAALPTDEFDLDDDGDTAEVLPYDYGGHARVTDISMIIDSGAGTPPIVDIGAFEAQELGAIVYVNSAAKGNRDGGSWANAFTNLQDAMAWSQPGMEIWVAAGMYKPSDSGDREAALLLRNEVGVYGGFSGLETMRDQREWKIYQTVLSGDLLENDNGDFSGYDDNSYNVIKSNALDASTVVDGFIITGGNASVYCENLDPCNQGAGGGMFNESSSPYIKDLSFIGNMAIMGGGILNSSSSPLLDNVTFSGNNATYGAGLYNDDSSPVLTDMTFSGNTACLGGGIYNKASSPVLTNVTFNDNTAENPDDQYPYLDCYGGGMYNVHSSNPDLTNVTLVSNSGGGMSNYYSSNPDLTNVTFVSNSGGGMSNYYSSNPVLTNVTFVSNSGRGMSNWESSPVLSEVIFNDNSGGGMSNRDSNLVLSDVMFIGNNAAEGAGMFNLSSNLVLTDITFSGNLTEYYNGGGMHNSYSTMTLTNVTFSGNSAECHGGGMYNVWSSPVLTNVTFSGNMSKENGGGMRNDASSLVLINVTLSGNTTEGSGGGMYNSGSDLIISNTIVWGNEALYSDPQIYNRYGSTPIIRYSDIQNSGGTGTSWESSLGIDGGGNIDAIPLFFRDPDPGADGTWGTADDDNGNLRLGPLSPAIDAGDNAAVPAEVTSDLDGNLRFVDIINVIDTGNGDAPIVDMGAYERPNLINSVYMPVILK